MKVSSTHQLRHTPSSTSDIPRSRITRLEMLLPLVGFVFTTSLVRSTLPISSVNIGTTPPSGPSYSPSCFTLGIPPSCSHNQGLLRRLPPRRKLSHRFNVRGVKASRFPRLNSVVPTTRDWTYPYPSYGIGVNNDGHARTMACTKHCVDLILWKIPEAFGKHLHVQPYTLLVGLPACISIPSDKGNNNSSTTRAHFLNSSTVLSVSICLSVLLLSRSECHRITTN